MTCTINVYVRSCNVSGKYLFRATTNGQLLVNRYCGLQILSLWSEVIFNDLINKFHTACSGIEEMVRENDNKRGEQASPVIFILVYMNCNSISVTIFDAYLMPNERTSDSPFLLFFSRQ